MSKQLCVSPNLEVAEFCLEGRFLNFVVKDGYKLKGLLIGTGEGECYVKLAKHLRFAFDLRLPPGTWLQIVGTKKYDAKTGEVKLKAERVMAARQQVEEVKIITPVQEKPAKTGKTTATILVCQKSDCMKRGGKALCQALEAELSDRHLSDQVKIKGTGCMKNCKAGPNLVMPDKTRYCRIQATQVSGLIDQHFPEASPDYQLDESKNLKINLPKFAEVTS
ncbi:MAG TPA: (2Fe-2S) ferredoxin domain-containing protein [Nostocaceae cyanobacterium]|nr:(2Fe-2S) ferredoxin domain-containing protein [Nostocaceae cyanobacterium]